MTALFSLRESRWPARARTQTAREQRLRFRRRMRRLRGIPRTPGAPSTGCSRKSSRLTPAGRAPSHLCRRTFPLIPAREFHVDAQVAVQVRLCAVEVEVADGNTSPIPADTGINRFANNSVHARERADVDDSGRAFFSQVDGFSYIEDHLPERAFSR